ncbi:MAG: DUF1016 family protein [Verrucomicrobia bacterium]|nr:DUF1016 family protein [Verrucomicrobiota bacterium]
MSKKSLPVVKKNKIFPVKYAAFITSLKAKIRAAQIKGAIAVNKELIKLYWEIGKEIHEKQKQEAWGSKVLERTAKDLQKGFPGEEGFSRRNIFRMRAFYQAYAKVPQLVAQLDKLPFFSIPWGHNALILEKVKNTVQRLWYAQKSIENGLSRSMLTIWIENDLYHREGKAITNFKTTIPAIQSDLAQQTLKDPYLFDFLTLRKEHLEKELEDGLVDHIQKFLIELGQGFSFVGQQYPIKAGKKDLYLDLLFYHLKLRCYVVVELKAGEFDSRDAGQMSAYLSAVDDQLKHEDDKPTIGIILCKIKDNVFVEYVLRNFNRPIGVAGFEVKMVEHLPKELKSNLPSVKEIEAELSIKPAGKKGRKKKT